MALQSTSVYVEKLTNSRIEKDINLEKLNLNEEIPTKNINEDNIKK